MAPLLEFDHEVIFFDQGSRKVSRAEEMETRLLPEKKDANHAPRYCQG